MLFVYQMSATKIKLCVQILSPYLTLFLGNVVNQTIIGAQASTAYSILKTLIFKKMVTVQIPLPVGKVRIYFS